MSTHSSNKFLQSLGSMRVALWILCAIIGIAFAGAVAPERVQPMIFYSWWFLAVLGVFAANLTVCLFRRLLSRHTRAGSKIAHASILLILAGSLISFLAGERGRIDLTRGEELTAFIGEKGEVPLGFSVLLDDFSVSWYVPQYFKLGVAVDGGKLKKKFDAVPGREYTLGDYSFVIHGYYPDFALDEENNPVNLSDKARNPALLLFVRAPEGSSRRWVFANHPDLSMSKDDPARIVLLQKPMVREFRSRLRFSDGKQVFRGDATVNGPVSFGGYTFYQSGYDAEKPDWTSLTVVKDPGVPVVFTGFILLNLGIIMIYAGKRRVARRRA